MQDTYRVDPNDLRSLPAGVAWVVTAGLSAKVAVARTPAVTGSAPATEPVVPTNADHAGGL